MLIIVSCHLLSNFCESCKHILLSKILNGVNEKKYYYLHFLSIGMMFEQEYMDLLNVALISIVSIVKKKRTDV